MTLDRSKTLLATSLVVLGVALAAIAMQMTHGRAPTGEQAYYLDLADGQLKTLPADTRTSAMLVSAVVVSCGGCNDPASVRVGWLESITEEGRQARLAVRGEADPAAQHRLLQVMEQSRRVAAAPQAGEEPQWHPARSPQGQAVVRDGKSICGESAAAAICLPR